MQAIESPPPDSYGRSGRRRRRHRTTARCPGVTCSYSVRDLVATSVTSDVPACVLEGGVPREVTGARTTVGPARAVVASRPVSDHPVRRDDRDDDRGAGPALCP